MPLSVDNGIHASWAAAIAGELRVEVRKRLSSAALERCVTRVLHSPGRIGVVFGMTSTLYI